VDGRREKPAGRGHRHVRRRGRQETGHARADQKAEPGGAHVTGAPAGQPQVDQVPRHGKVVVRRAERYERPVLGRRHQAQGGDDEVDGVPGDVLQQRPVPVRQVQVVFQRLSHHVRVHAVSATEDRHHRRRPGPPQQRRTDVRRRL